MVKEVAFVFLMVINTPEGVEYGAIPFKNKTECEKVADSEGITSVVVGRVQQKGYQVLKIIGCVNRSRFMNLMDKSKMKREDL